MPDPGIDGSGKKAFRLLWPCRSLRAVRFSAQLGYEIEEDTKEAIWKLAPNLKQISAERIQAELVKLAVSDHPD